MDIGTECVTHTGLRKQGLIFLSKSGQSDLHLCWLKCLGQCPTLSSQPHGATPRKPGRNWHQEYSLEEEHPQVSTWLWKHPTHYCMCTQTQVPRDRLHLMPTHNLWNCVVIGYTTQAQPYLPKSLRKIIEYYFFFLAPVEKDSVITFSFFFLIQGRHKHR